LATRDRVVALQLDAHDLETKIAGRLLDPNEQNRKMADLLTNVFSARATHGFIAFDADRIAASLHSDYGVRISRLVHLQTLVMNQKFSPNSFEALFSMFNTVAPNIFMDKREIRDQIEDAFNESCQVENYWKRLSFRATSAFFLQKSYEEEIAGVST
jgi:hypothetical protein